MLRPPSPQPEPRRDQHSGTDTCPAGGDPVQIGRQDEQSGQRDPAPRRPFEDTEQRKEAADGQADAPGQILLEHVRLGGQQHEDRAGQDGGHQHAVRDGLQPAHAGGSTRQHADPPHQQGGEHAGQTARPRMMKGSVSLPSRLLVTSRMGMRRRDGKRPK